MHVGTLVVTIYLGEGSSLKDKRSVVKSLVETTRQKFNVSVAEVGDLDLWRKATGRTAGFPVHVCYLVHNDFIAKNAGFPADLNAAQKDAVDVWYNKPARAMEIMADVTKLPKDVIQVAHKETVRMLSGLPEEQVETLIAQLKINKEFGFLKSDIWDQPDRVRREFFHRA